MSSQTQKRRPGAAVQAKNDAPKAPSAKITRIAVGVDGHPEGRDAVALGRAIAGYTGAELMLVAVQPDSLVPMPREMGRAALRKEAEKMLREVRDSLAPDARIDVETDFSVARALHRVARQHHRDLLIVGSSRDAADGRVRIGKRTRQLLCHFECALAIAPRGVHTQPIRLRKIGVGYDDGPEAEAALAVAAVVAAGAGTELLVRTVIDDRIPVLLRSALEGLIAAEWHEVISEESQRLGEHAAAAAARVSEAPVRVDALCGRPADALLSLSEEVDLLVIGSRRWGPAARVLLGITGEAVMHDAACPVLTVPRPAT